MGCSFGKGHSNENGKEGKKEVDGKVPDIPAPAPPDPRLPLTAKQRFSITKSWKGIARAMEVTGLNMFIKLFQDNEDLLNLFEKFQYLRTKESQRSSMELAQHASVVMTTLDEAINSLDNMDFFLDYLHSVGKFHRKIPGFQKDYFWRIEKPFLDAVEETLGDRYTENIENIYKITIRFILDTLVNGFEKGGGEENGTASVPAQSSTSNGTTEKKVEKVVSSNPSNIVQNNV